MPFNFFQNLYWKSLLKNKFKRFLLPFILGKTQNLDVFGSLGEICSSCSKQKRKNSCWGTYIHIMRTKLYIAKFKFRVTSLLFWSQWKYYWEASWFLCYYVIRFFNSIFRLQPVRVIHKLFIRPAGAFV